MTGGEWAYLSTSLSTIQDGIRVDTASATFKDRSVGTATIVQGRPLTLSTWRFWRGGRGASESLTHDGIYARGIPGGRDRIEGGRGS